MRKPRHYIDIAVSANEIITLSKDEAHHIAHVLRMKPGDQIILFSNDGYEYESKIIEITKKQTQIEVGKPCYVENESPLTINLCLAIARGQHMDIAIQKAVELGVKNIIPLISEFSNVKIQDSRKQNKMTHWQNIIISASEQCGRCKLVQLQEPVPFKEWLGLDRSEQRLILHPGSKHSLSEIDLDNNEVTLMVGPEGGFSENEINQAEGQGCIPVSLGPRILRAETAVISAVSNAQQIWGDLN